MNTRIQEIKNVMKGIGRGTGTGMGSSASFSLPSFATLTTAGSPKIKYALYVIVAIAAIAALILFLQALGINIIRKRPGAPGIIASPFSSGDSKTITTPTDQQLTEFSKFLQHTSIFTISTVLTVKTRQGSDTKPIMILYYSDKQISSSPIDTTIIKSDDINTIFSNPTADDNFQLAIWMSGVSNVLYVQFYYPSSSNNKDKSIIRLDNPPLNKPFRISVIVNSIMAEVYSGGKLAKTIVTKGKSISPYDSPSGRQFYAPLNSSVTLEALTLWNAPLTFSEIAAL